MLSLSCGPGSLSFPCHHEKIVTVLIVSGSCCSFKDNKLFFLSNWCDINIASTVTDGQALLLYYGPNMAI